MPAAEIPELTAAPLGRAGARLGGEAPKGGSASRVGLAPPGLLAFRGKAVRCGDLGDRAWSWLSTG